MPYKDTGEDLNFSVCLRNFRLRNVKSESIYVIKIIFETKGVENKEFLLKFSSGPVAKFSLNEQFLISLPFNQLVSKYIIIVCNYLCSYI